MDDMKYKMENTFVIHSTVEDSVSLHVEDESLRLIYKKNNSISMNHPQTSFIKLLFGRIGDFIASIIPQFVICQYYQFKEGTHHLLRDMRHLILVYYTLGFNSPAQVHHSLTWRQLEIYRSLPSDLLRVAPVLLVSMLPFAQNVAFPLALMFPRQLLSTHYWTDLQRRNITLENIQEQHKQFFPLLSLLQHGIFDCNSLSSALTLLNQGDHPSVQMILSFQSVFASSSDGYNGQFCLSRLSDEHISYLLVLWSGTRSNLGWKVSKRKWLLQCATLLQQIDIAIQRDSLNSLSDNDLLTCCSVRGLNPYGLHSTKLKQYLEEWLMISVDLDLDCISLLLHLPILLGYNSITRFWSGGYSLLHV